MTVIVIDEENHGRIGVAKDYASAIDFLVNGQWLFPRMFFYDLNDTELKNPQPLEVLYGENWIDRLKSFSEEEAEEFFDGSFYFSKENVFGA